MDTWFYDSDVATFEEVAGWLARLPEVDQVFTQLAEALEVDPDDDGEMLYVPVGFGG